MRKGHILQILFPKYLLFLQVTNGGFFFSFEMLITNYEKFAGYVF